MSEKVYAQPVQVTKAALPPLDKYIECVREIFDSHWLTNQGVYVTRLEKELSGFLGTEYLSLCANGTLALQLGLRLLHLDGKKIITTPFTYVATLSALLWEGCVPLFADIDPETLCLDPARAEGLIRENPDVAGILPVHVYGNACDVDAFEKLAMRHNLKILYDAAHAFGSLMYGKSLISYGDASICSFHSTKLFHTVEGGCLVASSPKAHEEARLMRAFGHIGDNYESLGINAKMSELHAAMGICMLEEMPKALARRAELCAIYNAELDINGASGLKSPRLAKGLEWNHAYYPVIFPDHESMTRAIGRLNRKNINPRRYFYPSLTKLPYVKSQPCPISEDMAERVLCLPFWADMDEELVADISSSVLSAI